MNILKNIENNFHNTFLLKKVINMTTQKRMTIPIFNYKLTVVIYDDWNEVSYLDSDENRNYPSKGFTKWQYGSALVAINAKHGSTIVHEAEHVKNLIWEYIGYTPMVDNDEVDQHLHTYIYEQIKKVLNKHMV